MPDSPTFSFGDGPFFLQAPPRTTRAQSASTKHPLLLALVIRALVASLGSR